VTGSEVVQVRGLTHRFGRLAAVDDVDLTLREGEIYGFLGRNGAGKTTLIRTLLGLLTPTRGKISLFGEPVRGGRTAPEVWTRVGYLVEGPGLYPQLTVRDHLKITARYRRLGRHGVEMVLARLQLTGYADVPARRLSLGNRQRLGLALALVHRPALLILDEPVNGLDPAGVVEVRGLLRELADDGATVFMSSHLVVEVAQLADRIGIIHQGRLVTEMSRTHLDQADAGRRLAVGFRSPVQAEQARAALTAWGLDCTVEGAQLTSTQLRGVEQPDAVVVALVEAGAAPMSVTIQQETLEHVFLRLTAPPPSAGDIHPARPAGVA
jgi:ABC-2 type transport system ATP-binding protein